MTKDEIIQQIKNEALNNIAKIYNPKYKFDYYECDNIGEYCGDDVSCSEQREHKISSIIEQMHKDIEETKKKYKV